MEAEREPVPLVVAVLAPPGTKGAAATALVGMRPVVAAHQPRASQLPAMCCPQLSCRIIGPWVVPCIAQSRRGISNCRKGACFGELLNLPL